MATKANYSGLLSKVVKFVRHPTRDWSELDDPEPSAAAAATDLESGYTKQALKEMIERKRKNDFVRRREFDQLRRLRRNEPLITPELAGQPSFFQSSLSAYPDERASTIKKIDEIEAQMSHQWWKARPPAAAPAAEPAKPSASAAAQLPSFGDSVLVNDSFASTQASMMRTDSAPSSTLEYPPTMMGAQTPELQPRVAVAPPLAVPSVQGPVSAYGGPASRAVSAFSSSRLFAIDPGDRLSDADLEEAAIRFANGDDAGAEAGLLTALAGNRLTPETAEGWVTALLDLYRATARRDSFERMAFDYARRFGRAMPVWPEAGPGPGPERSGPAGATLETDFADAWRCPTLLDANAVRALREQLSTALAPWRLDWRALEGLAPEAAGLFAELVAQWCGQAVTLHFRGADVLERTLRAGTPSGDKRVDLRWWRLRLDTLRLMRLQDEFELAALDYCVTFEESPPTWVDAQCDYVPERLSSSAGRADGRSGPAGESVALALRAPTMNPAMNGAPVVALSGEVLGEAMHILQRFSDQQRGADRLLIDCERLIRVDFSAAGSILNWVAVRQSEGCRVEFQNVPRLVAAFFNVIGINEHAPLSLRGL